MPDNRYAVSGMTGNWNTSPLILTPHRKKSRHRGTAAARTAG